MHVGSRQEGYRAQLYHWLAFSGFYTDLPSSSQSTVCRYITVLIEQVFRGISSDQNVQCFVHAGSLKMALSVVDPSGLFQWRNSVHFCAKKSDFYHVGSRLKVQLRVVFPSYDMIPLEDVYSSTSSIYTIWSYLCYLWCLGTSVTVIVYKGTRKLFMV
jgi:hypothetical protein